MTQISAFTSALRSPIKSYLELKFAQGYRFDRGLAVLRSVDRLLSGLPRACQDLTEETFRSWCTAQSEISPGERRRRMNIIRNFCLYRRRTMPNCFVPDPIFFPSSHQAAAPYVFSESQIAQLLTASSGLRRPPDSPLRPEMIRLAIVLLYSTGLRRGELLRLTIGDFEIRREGTLLVRASKFHKSRILPLPQDVIGEIDFYLRMRRQHNLPVLPNTPLIWNRRNGGRAYTGFGFQTSLMPLFDVCSIHTTAGRPPRIHDFRHSFAVNALIRWYRAGCDVQTKLPFLAAYMGHVSIVSTYHYLHFIEPLRTLASNRFCDCYGGLVTPVSMQNGGGA